MYASLQQLTQAANLSESVMEHLRNAITLKHASKGSLLLMQGQRCNHLYIIEKGFARIFSTINGKEITTLFARENDIITSTHALFTQVASNENIQILEDSLLLKINYNDLVNICKVHTELFTF